MPTPSLTLSQSSVLWSPITKNYRFSLTVTNQVGLVDNCVFKMQRLQAINKVSFTDVVRGTCDAEEMQSLCAGAPCNGTSFWRNSCVTFTCKTPEYANVILQTVLAQLQNLVTDVEVLDNLVEAGVYTITSGAINFAMYLSHTHYRLPLVAQPCGTSESYTVDGVVYQEVGSQDTTLQGWLNCVESDPAGYHFKYNIATDNNLPGLWPPAANKIDVAYLEVNGIVYDDASVLCNANGIFWAPNTYGQAPWPATYGADMVPPDQAVILVLDFIV